jgi:nitronate monooxygenase
LADHRLDRIRLRLSLPLIAAPMFLVSGVELVVAACLDGVVGAFPTANCRSAAELDQWLVRAQDAIERGEQKMGCRAAPICVNLIVHKSNSRLAEDLAALCRRPPELVITSVGSPRPAIAPLHDLGVLVLADVASIEHAEKALKAGADGLVLLTAGAGGQTGWLNPLAFVRAVRAFYAGPLVLAGGISDGYALLAAEMMGYDLAYMGTKFIATHESLAKDAYKDMLVAASADDIQLSRAFTGLETNMLRPSIAAAGLDPSNLPTRAALDVSKDISVEGKSDRPARWRDIWSAGHSVSGVDAIRGVGDLIAHTRAEYQVARVAAQQRLAAPRQRPEAR